MEFTLTVTGSSPADLLSVLNSFGNPAPAAATVSAKTKTVKLDPPAETPKAELPAASEPAPTSTPTTPAPAATTGTAAVTIEQVRAAVQTKAQEGKRDQVKELLAEFEVENVTKMPAAKYADFLNRVNAL